MPTRRTLCAAALLCVSVAEAVALQAPAAWAAVSSVSRSYASSSAAMANPDRGFTKYSETHAYPGGAYTPLDLATVTNWRTSQSVTTVYRIFYLERYVNSNLDASYLASVAADLATARAAGVKLLIRFAYSDSSSADATPARVIAQIHQLAPVINAAADVVETWQAGFIGTWGEWYYTDHFSVSPGTNSDQNWADRANVLNALLDSTNPSIFIQVRYPAIKQRLVPPGDPRAARVGIHDDCFQAGTEDYGTFAQPSDWPWLAEQSKTVPISGESCTVNAPRTLWPAASAALAQNHWSYLNADYESNVLASWGTDQLAEVQRRLGYRLRLSTAVLPATATTGDTMGVQLTLTNDGYAAPLRNRPVQLVLTSAAGSYRVALPVDLRAVTPGATIPVSMSVPAPAVAGSYALSLALPDAAPSLTDPAYSIQLANPGVWNPATGLNDLGQTVTVTTGTGGGGTVTPVRLSTLTATNVSNGWGPAEINSSNGEAAAGDGHPLTVRGVVYPSGLGVHAGSSQTFALGRRYTTFSAGLGVDDEELGKGSVRFRVYADNQLAYTSPLLTGAAAVKSIRVQISGVQSLRLVVTDGGDGNWYDHADWLTPTLR